MTAEASSFDRKLNVAIQIAMFSVTVWMAVASKWAVTDLVWSLWISSLTVGYSLILASIFGMLVRGNAAGVLGRKPGEGAATAGGTVPSAASALPLNVFIGIACVALGLGPVTLGALALVAASTALAIGGVLRDRPGWGLFPDPERGLARLLITLPSALFMLAFFTVHFGGFHFVHGLFLNSFFPLVGQSPFGKEPGDVFGIVGACAREALTRYWPFVAASGLSRLPTYAAAFRTTDGSMMFTPYLNVIRMHVMIFVFAFLGAAGLAAYGLYPLLVMYFLPVGDLVALLRTRRAPQAPGTPSEPS